MAVPQHQFRLYHTRQKSARDESTDDRDAATRRRRPVRRDLSVRSGRDNMDAMLVAGQSQRGYECQCIACAVPSADDDLRAPG